VGCYKVPRKQRTKSACDNESKSVADELEEIGGERENSKGVRRQTPKTSRPSNSHHHCDLPFSPIRGRYPHGHYILASSLSTNWLYT
jgi:hypothetical protein